MDTIVNYFMEAVPLLVTVVNWWIEPGRFLLN